MAMSDQQLLSRIASGDGAAFADFYDRHAARVLGLVQRWLGRREDAEDVLQEVFWQVWCRAASYDAGRSPPQGWLVLIARSRALDHLRRRRPEATASADSEAVMLDDPAAALEQDEASRQVREALTRLPDEQRSALTLAFFGGLTNEQVARQQAVPLGTAKTRIRRGMQRLRDLLDG